MTKQAIEKLNKLDEKKLSPKGKAVGTYVVKVLTDFCRQNAEFAQAIVQSGKTVNDCVEAAVKGAGNSISDFDVYSKAAAFWFEGATVKFTMTLDLGDGGFSNTPESSEGLDTPDISGTADTHKRLELALDDLLDF